jgi:hypothetical protein
MSDLKTQLREYCSHLDELHPTPDVEQFIPTPVVSPRRKWVVALAAAAITVVVIGAVPLLIHLWESTEGDLSGPGTQAPATTLTPPDTSGSGAQTSVTTAPSPEDIPEPTTAASVPETSAVTAPLPVDTGELITAVHTVSRDGWTRSNFPYLIGDGEVVGITASGDTVVAVGTLDLPCLSGGFGSDHPPCRSLAWVSVDRGSTWQMIEIGERGDNVMAVTATELGFLAVGENESGGSPQGVIWESEDGITWERRTDSAFGGSRLDDVAVGGAGVAAAGVCYGDEGCPIAVWTSTDGQTWSEPDVFEDETLLFVGITAYGGGYAVAAHLADMFDSWWRVWVSGDDGTWIESDPGVSSDGLIRIVGNEEGLVLTPAGVWATWSTVVHSTDGITWTPIVVDECPLRRFIDMSATSDRYIGVAYCPTLRQVGVWISDDGINWHLDHLLDTDDAWQLDHRPYPDDIQAVHADEQGIIVIGRSAVWITDTSSP